MLFERNYKNNIFLTVLCAVGAGFLTGCLYVGFFCGGRLSQICAVYKTSFEGSAQIVSTVADVLFFTGSLFLLGLSLYGFWVCEIFVFAKAMTFGMLASACYCLNCGKGAMIVATVILPYAFLLLTVLCLFCTEATDLSYHVYRATDRKILKSLIKRYCSVSAVLFAATAIPVLWRVYMVPLAMKYICSTFI